MARRGSYSHYNTSTRVGVCPISIHCVGPCVSTREKVCGGTENIDKACNAVPSGLYEEHLAPREIRPKRSVPGVLVRRRACFALRRSENEIGGALPTVCALRLARRHTASAHRVQSARPILPMPSTPRHHVAVFATWSRVSTCAEGLPVQASAARSSRGTCLRQLPTWRCQGTASMTYIVLSLYVACHADFRHIHALSSPSSPRHVATVSD